MQFVDERDRVAQPCRPALISVVWMEDQRPNLDTFPRIFILILLIHKCTMRHSPRPTIDLTIETLDQGNLFWTLLMQIVPLMRLVWPHRACLSHTVRIDQLHGKKI